MPSHYVAVLHHFYLVLDLHISNAVANSKSFLYTIILYAYGSVYKHGFRLPLNDFFRLKSFCVWMDLYIQFFRPQLNISRRLTSLTTSSLLISLTVWHHLASSLQANYISRRLILLWTSPCLQLHISSRLTYPFQEGVTSFIEKECVWSKYNISIQREAQFVDSYGSLNRHVEHT